MGLAKGSGPFIVWPLAVAALLYAGLVYMVTESGYGIWSWPALAVGLLGDVALLLGLFGLWFFRDPERAPSDGIVCPADGKVLFVETLDDPDVGPASERVAIFMSPLNVHVNRAPVTGTLRAVTHHAGGYLPAFNKESERNERVVTLWESDGSDAGGLPAGATLKAVQIAGAVARRIVPWRQAGDRLAAGERYGLIRYGSRVDVYLPAGTLVDVVPGETVRAGTTRLAHAPGPDDA